MESLPITNFISESSQMSLVEQMAEVQYENFYPQRSYVGDTGFRKYMWTIVWTPVTREERDTIAAFFDAHSLVVPFNWFAFNDTQERAWVFKSVPSVSNLGGDKYSITVDLLEEFVV